MELRITAISDMHYTPEPKVQVPKRYGDYSPAFVDAAIDMIDNEIRPDVLLVAGDLVDLPEQEELLKELAPHILQAKSRMIVIPGNHDPAPETFFKYLPEPPPFVDINGHRIAIVGSTLRPRSVDYKTVLAKELRATVWPLIESGRVRPVIHSTFPAAQAAQAHALMESSSHVGKIVLSW